MQMPALFSSICRAVRTIHEEDKKFVREKDNKKDAGLSLYCALQSEFDIIMVSQIELKCTVTD